MQSLDVHIAVIPSIPKEWMDQCIDSVNKAKSSATFPINIHVFDGIKDHIGKTRQLGYSMGTSEYVTYVDADDYILPDAFSCLTSAISDQVAMIRTGEILLQNGIETKLSIGNFHLMAYRRDILETVNYIDHPVDIDVKIKEMGLNHKDGSINIPTYAYVHRIYWNSGSRVLYRKLRESGISNV